MDDLAEKVLLEGAVLGIGGFGAVFTTGEGQSLPFFIKALEVVGNDATKSKGTT